MDKLINITELSKLLGLVDTKTKKPSNHILRYWEKQFKDIKPTVLKKRRYYSKKQIEKIKMIKFLLKEKGMTINGVKNILKLKINTLDDYNSISLKADYHKNNIKLKTKKILDQIKRLKKDGKKNTY